MAIILTVGIYRSLVLHITGVNYIYIYIYFRIIVPKSSTIAYNNSALMMRDNIAQISGEISYRFYFEPQVKMYVPYTEFIATQLRFFMNQYRKEEKLYGTETQTGTETEEQGNLGSDEGKDLSLDDK